MEFDKIGKNKTGKTRNFEQNHYKTFTVLEF